MKKIFLLLGTGVCLLIACNNDEPKVAGVNDEPGKETSAEAMEERNKRIAMETIENGINKHDADALMKHMAPDGKDYGDGSYPPSGRDSSIYYITEWFKAFPDVKGENLVAVADGDYVVVWGDWTGTWKGDYMGQKATGKSYKIRDADIFRFNKDGQITEHHYIQNWKNTAAQIGMKME